MNHVDLFSGIGGFAIAAQTVGWRTVAFCEVDQHCVNVIERQFASDRWLSLPGSIPGREKGWTKRGPELLSLDADWLVVENTYHRWRAWVPQLRSELHVRGYASLPLRVRAADVGAVHLRARGWLVANSNSEQLRELSRWFCGPGREVARELAESWDSAPRGLGTDDGLPDWVDRRHALGNAIVPRAAELIFRGIQAVC